MLKTNESKVVEFLLQCQPGPPWGQRGWNVDHKGKPFYLPSIGGITVNVQIGDSAFGWAGDHIEPGVSCTADTHKPNEHPNRGVQTYACAGNIATIVSGKAKGKKGVVIGHHGGSEHLIVEFPKEVKAKMTYDDKIIINAKGQGLTLLDYPKIRIINLAPSLLKKMNVKQLKNKKLKIPVTTLVPASCMGSGIGDSNIGTGDYDIMTSDPSTVKKYKLDQIRFGDFVALLDQDNTYGRTFKKGAITIGIVVHSDCLNGGHGPGVTTLISSVEKVIEPIISRKANIADILKIGKFKK
ncbi:MAG: DUF4438 domain-containing protein [candidate division Zixibacteria bacterium]|nr:DUF4438 domain-containing protein [candidate division Zixibacteria bacterium]